MEDLRKWYSGGLPASIEALKTARKTLPKSAAGMESIRRIARSLKGSAAGYGFSALSESARLLEQSGKEELAGNLDRLLSELIRVGANSGSGDLPAILIVEHEAQMCRLLETILAGQDREVASVGSAGEAFVLLENRQFSLIILDLSLPDTDGRNFLMHLRERAGTSGVPVIVLSGIHGPQPKTECFALGADAYFEKPIAPEVLKAAVSARLHKSVEHRRVARQDALTGLPNRAAFCEGFQRISVLAARKHEPLSLALLDCDLFKRVNDHLGLVAGDSALRHAAGIFSASLRRSDFLARWGGDEFALLLPSTGLPGARSAVEKMLSSLAESPFRGQDGRPIPLSFSAGLVTVAPEYGVEQAMAEADRCLYLAKTGGRGRLFSEADHSGASPGKILVADADERAAAAIADSLGREGFEVMHCREGSEALRAALAHPFSLWILDLHQEASPGRSLLLDLRNAWRTARVPVLLLATPGSDRELARGFEMGADDYLIKPFTPYDLMARVRTLLRK